MSEELVCWHCGHALDGLPLPLPRLAECPGCRSELHVCRLCSFFDPTVSQACREPVADEVKDKERANFCGYFQPRPNAYVASDGGQEARAQAELAALFGDTGGAGEEGDAEAAIEPDRQALDDLFRKD